MTVDGIHNLSKGIPTKKVETLQELSPEQFRDWVQTKHGLILDVRPKEVFRLGHIPGALSFPATYFEGSYLRLSQKLEVDKSQPIAVYCSDAQCGSADFIGRKLAGLEFTHIAVFSGGWQAWQSAALPKETGE